MNKEKLIDFIMKFLKDYEELAGVVTTTLTNYKSLGLIVKEMTYSIGLNKVLDYPIGFKYPDHKKYTLEIKPFGNDNCKSITIVLKRGLSSRTMTIANIVDRESDEIRKQITEWLEARKRFFKEIKY